MEKNFNWLKAGNGYEGVENTIQLYGWSHSRRVIILRRRIKNKNIGVLRADKIENEIEDEFLDNCGFFSKNMAPDFVAGSPKAF